MKVDVKVIVAADQYGNADVVVYGDAYSEVNVGVGNTLLDANSERFAFTGDVRHLYAPAGIKLEVATFTIDLNRRAVTAFDKYAFEE